MAVDADRAREVLALVETDPAARADFVASWRSDEDAVAALTEAADAARPSPSSVARAARLASNRRAAFGRGDDPEGGAAAAARDEIERDRAAASGVADALEVAVAAVLDGAGRRAAAATPARVRRPRRIGAAVALAVGVVAVAIGLKIATAELASTSDPTLGVAGSSPTAQAPPIVTLAPTAGLLRRFGGPATERDRLTVNAGYTTALRGASSRFVMKTPDGTTLLIARTPSGGLCLVIDRVPPLGASLATCETREQFAAGVPLLIGQQQLTARWNTDSLRVEVHRPAT